MNSAHVGLNVTESEQDREDSGRDLDRRKGYEREQGEFEKAACT